MNKTLMITLAAMKAVGDWFNSGTLSSATAPGTPRIPNRGGRQHCPHAPNDGHWHMKYHRNRH